MTAPLEKVKAKLEQVKVRLELVKIFNATSSFTNFEVQKYYQNEPKFNEIYSRNNLPKIKDGAYVINLNEYDSKGIHCMALYLNGNNITYFDCFGVEHIPKEIEKFIVNKNMQKYNNKYL